MKALECDLFLSFFQLFFTPLPVPITSGCSPPTLSLSMLECDYPPPPLHTPTSTHARTLHFRFRHLSLIKLIELLFLFLFLSSLLHRHRQRSIRPFPLLFTCWTCCHLIQSNVFIIIKWLQFELVYIWMSLLCVSVFKQLIAFASFA